MKYLMGFFISLFVVFSQLFAYDFQACQDKSKLSLEKIGNDYAVAIESLNDKKSKLFLYSPRTTPKGYNILKHDPFVGMYLLESKKNLTPVTLREITPQILEEEIASITPQDNISGKIQTLMQSPIDFATLNIPTFSNSLISTICDHIYGIGIGENKFIEKKYLERFLKSDSIYYGDIGIRVFENSNDRVEVDIIDPFFKNNPFEYGDIIMMINGEAIGNVSDFHRVVFDLEQDSIIPVRIERNKAIINVEVEVDKRRGGLLLPEDFLGRIGIEISNNFTITSIAPDASNGFEQLKVGDKILSVNKKNVPQGYDAIIRLLGEFPDQQQKWLVARDDFYFFLEVNKKDDDTTNETEEIREYF
ncbi:PDZ domain-containing protein [Helicobacter apodemus]|uniref:PDZ domain-containing protein n=1 Tax=Helicobacter apodemus TaxID=135569 RepID=A0A4U8UF40_9HELI|nr:PDZ domain-containing protein [Helicobacter apodemus]TLE14986.1 PDZ domain-containing protein [Helicobacter apodemus]